MNTKKRGTARKYLEDLLGSPLTLGALLEAIREADELSQADFARALGISASHLCDIEKGRKVISPGRAARFAKILGFDQTQFVRLSLQGQLDHEGLKFKIELKAAS